jgi:hemolysin activation/secretion protein
MRVGVCRFLAALAMVVATAAAVAQPLPPSVQPGRERERFTPPVAPLSEPGGSAISLPSTVAPPGADRIMVRVRGIRIVGNTVFTQEQLAPLYADLVGKRVTLQAVYDLAQKITTKYGDAGYVISRAIVPPQELNPGGATIRIQVIEGYVDKVEWPKALDKYVYFFSYYTSRIIAERPTNIHTIERYLLLAGDLPGLKFKNSLKPSANHQGAATLVVNLTDEKLVDAAVRIDNRGTQSQGPLEGQATATLNNPLRIHDAWTFTYAGPFKSDELKYFYGQYSQVISAEGLQFFADYSEGYGRPRLSPDFQAIAPDYRTQSTVFETGLTFPFVRTRERNFSVTGLFFESHNEASTPFAPDGPPSSLDRLRGGRIKINADAADPLSAINQLNIVLSQGINGLGSTMNGALLASRVNGRVDFSKVEGTFTRMQPLPANFSFLFAVYGQYAAGTPLLSSELCGYGGRVFGRAYDPSDLVADSCVEELAELRFDVPTMPWTPKELTQIQYYGFIDNGWLHNLAPDVGTPRNQQAASAGGGLRLGWWNSIAADLSAAKAVEGPRNIWRFFFILSAKY